MPWWRGSARNWCRIHNPAASNATVSAMRARLWRYADGGAGGETGSRSIALSLWQFRIDPIRTSGQRRHARGASSRAALPATTVGHSLAPHGNSPADPNDGGQLMGYTLEQFSADCHRVLAAEPGPEGRKKVCALVQKACADEAFVRQHLPENAPERKILYEDPEL